MISAPTTSDTKCTPRATREKPMSTTMTAATVTATGRHRLPIAGRNTSTRMP